jgi:hypothetical protein
MRKDLAWKANIRLFRIWKNVNIDNKVKINLFRSTIESILLYNATTWTITATLAKKLDGAYTKLLRYALNVKWTEKKTNKQVYGNLLPVSVRLKERRMIFAGHCWRSNETAKQPISKLLWWSVPKGINSKSPTTYIQMLLEDAGYGSVKKKEIEQNVSCLQEQMTNRVAWRKLVSKRCLLWSE